MKNVKKSAGILLYRFSKNSLQFFLVHPGGPFWQKKDVGVWTIPKGEFDNGEDALAAAVREFREETDAALSGDFIPLEPVTQKAGKVVYAWAKEGDIDAKKIRSNEFEIEWPPKSGRWKSYPEVDKAAWFDSETARQKINPAQIGLIDELINKIKSPQ